MARRIPVFRPPGSQAGRRAQARHYDRHRRDREAKRFYDSAPWQKLRRLKLSLDPLCESCKSQGRITPANQVHHKQERRDHPELALYLDNLQSLCLPCHNSARRNPNP